MASQRLSVSAVREGMRLATGRAGCRMCPRSRGGVAVWLSWARLYFREQQPGCAESVPQHRESSGEERLFHLHEHLPLLGEELVQPFCFLYVVRGECDVRAAHRLGAGDVGSEEHGVAHLEARVQNFLLPVLRHLGIGLLLVRQQDGDLAAELLLVEAERRFAGAGVIDVRVESHVAFRLGGMDSCCYPEVRRTTLAEIDRRA